MFRRIAVIFIVFFLISCGEKTPKRSDGNIDVDSEIYIIPIGDVDEKYLTALVPKLETRFTTKVHVDLGKRMPRPDYAYNPDAKKYVAMYILTEMKKLDFPANAKILGVANVGLFIPGSDLQFLFGQALRGRAAIISTLHMDPNSYVGGKPDDDLLIQRMEKEAVHELGHVFGLDNVNTPECVMYLPRDVRGLDRKTDSFCSECQKEFELLKGSKKLP